MSGSKKKVKKTKEVALSQVKDDLSKYLRLAVREEIVITRHGKPAGVLIGFGSDDEWFEYRLQKDPRFLTRIERARASLRSGRGVRLEDIGE
jgi:prevent-host-death family protein